MAKILNDQGSPPLRFDLNNRPFPFVPYALGITFIISAAYFIGGGLLAEFMFGDEDMVVVSWLNAAAQLLFMLSPALLATIPMPVDFKVILRLNRNFDIGIFILSIIALISFQFFVSGYAVLQEALIPEALIDEYDKLREMIESIYNTVLGGESASAFIRALIVGAVVPAISEESLFRGFLQGSLEQKLRPLTAILISGFIFGMIHFNPIDMIPLIIIGIFLGFLAYASKNILLPIIIHFLNNAFAIVVFFSADAQEIEQSAESLSVQNAAVLSFGGLAITFLFCYMIYRRSKVVYNA